MPLDPESATRPSRRLLRIAAVAVIGAALLGVGYLVGRSATSSVDGREPLVDGSPATAVAPPAGGVGNGGHGEGQGPPGTRPAAGKWRRARTAPAIADGSESEPGAEALMALPYLQGYRPAGEGGDTIAVHHPTAAYQGWNLYVSGHGPEAVLMDMRGRVRHRWRYPLEKLRPQLYEDPRIQRLDYFRRARLLPGGELLAIFEGLGLVKLDAESNLLWAYRGGAHHDLDVAPDGRIWLLDRAGGLIPRIDPERGVLEDRVTVLSPGGEVVRQISILEAFERSVYAPLVERRARGVADIFHTNTLEILDGRLADRVPAFRRGNLLVSVLELDTVAVIDPDREEVVWALSGPWRKQHQPTVLDSGRLLVFDNLGAGGERSRILEVDPLSQAVHWRYGGGGGVDFFSKTLGSVQRLPNGNTLVTESENGRAFEVTPAGRTVWEFRSPHRAGENGELVAVLPELERLRPDFPVPGRRTPARTAGTGGRG